jgi:hypothetical protein
LIKYGLYLRCEQSFFKEQYMLSIFQQFVNNLNKPKNWLLLANVFLVIFLIVFNNLGIIPLRTGDFVFFLILILILALYRPSWAFLFFVGTIPLENINLAPFEFGIAIRPYQFIGALTIIAITVRFFSGKLNFNLIRPRWYDLLIIIVGLSSFLSIINTENKMSSLKLSIILATFIALYFLVRNYVQNLEDLKKIIPFFLSSSLIVVIYGIWQNVRFFKEMPHFEVMPGRPNATFFEADWLGIYLAILISVCYILIYFFQLRFKNDTEKISNFEFSIFKKITNYKLQIIKIFLFFLLTSYFLLLILTVSRSAWLGAFAATVMFLFIIFTKLRLHPKHWQWKKTFQIKLLIFSAFVLSVFLVYIFNLTNFQLFNRVQSTASGMQKITISCENKINLPESVENVSELENYNCRHINLEEIEFEKNRGNYVEEIYRKDPNVHIRSQVYQKSWEQIKKHWFLGIGWGNIENFLGSDERGASLNSSNIFLEIWLGSGILGLISFVILIFYILLCGIKNYYFYKNSEENIFGLFLIISWFAIVVPNFFNAGIFLGFFWLWLSIAQIKIKK